MCFFKQTDNKEVRNKRKSKGSPFYKGKEFRLSILLVLLAFMWAGVAPEWYSWYSDEGNGLWMKAIFSILDGNWLFNLPVCLVIGYLFLDWCVKIYHDNDFRFYRLGLLIFSCAIFAVSWDQVQYAQLLECWPQLSYRTYMLFCLTVVLVMILWKSFPNFKNLTIVAENSVKGFTIDDIEGEDEKYLEPYAKHLLDRLMQTDVGKQSFAVGVTGSWGVGKTTFLKIIEREIADRAEVVRFNPWMCRTPMQVTQDFFALLSKALTKKYSTLANPIKKYAKHINNITVSANSIITLEANTQVADESLDDRKNELSAKLSNISKPVIVIIDDLDRMEADEIFEVLRLIRNTADLKNVIYIVAYDKEYVTSILENKNIFEPERYLEKIFLIETHLPKVEEYLIWDMLINDMKKQNTGLERFVDALAYRIRKDYSTIIKVLGNFRRAKRFARLFMLNYSYLYGRYKEDIKVLDYFWLELLHAYDKESYDKLALNPDVFLVSKDGLRFSLKKNLDASGAKEYSQDILKIIFDQSKPISASVCYVANYSKYFSLSVPPHRLSENDMRLFIESTEDVKCYIDANWQNKNLTSMCKRFEIQTKFIDSYRESKLLRFVEGMLVLTVYKGASLNLKTLLSENNFSDNNVKGFVVGWFEKIIDNCDQYVRLSQILSSLYATTYIGDEDPNEAYASPSIINNNDVSDLLKRLIGVYLNNHSEVNALDVLAENSELFEVFGNCCVCIQDETYVQIVFDEIINHFAGKEDKPSQQEYVDAYNQLFVDLDYDRKDSDDYYDLMETIRESKLTRHFGDNLSTDLRRFKDMCFR